MNLLHRLLYALFFLLAIIFAIQFIYIYVNSGVFFNIPCLELAPSQNIDRILSRWSSVQIHKYTLLDHARFNTWLDFIFTVSYSGVLVMFSYTVMQMEKNPWLNNALRFCMLLAIVAGLLDIIENVILLENFNEKEFGPGNYYSSAYLSYPKFFLIGVILLLWIVSFATRKINESKH